MESSNFYIDGALSTSDVDETLPREEVTPRVLNCNRQQNSTVIGGTCRTPNVLPGHFHTLVNC